MTQLALKHSIAYYRELHEAVTQKLPVYHKVRYIVPYLYPLF